MKIVFTTYLSFIILFQGVFTSTTILFKTGKLLEDYQIHKVKYNDTIVTFLSKHFGELKESHQQQHEEEHKQHKHPQSDFNADFQTDYFPLAFSLAINNCIVKENKNNRFFYQDLFSTFEKQKIFQPPKVA